MMFGFILESSSQHRQNTLADRYGLDVFQVLTGQAWGL